MRTSMMRTFTRGLLFASLFGPMTISLFANGQPLNINMNRDLGTYSIGRVQIGLNASGGSGNYTWSLASGALPSGLNIAPIPGNASQTGLVGIATCAACTGGGKVYGFSLTVNDGNTSVTQPFEMRVTTLTLQDINLPDVFVGQPFSYKFTALNSQSGKPTFDVTAPGLPVGLSLSATGTLSGTMPDPGNYQINLSVFDGTDEIYRGFQLNVYQIGLNPIAPLPLGVFPNAIQGAVYTATLTASGGIAPYQFALLGSLPNGLSMSPEGVISGAANAGPGLYGFNVFATDSAGNSYQKTMSLDVIQESIAQNRITLGLFSDAVAGLTFGLQIPTCCGGVAPFKWSATGLPAGMSIRSGSGITSDYVTPGWGEIWGVASTPGTYFVTVTVTDAQKNSSSLTFPLHVSELFLAPNGNLPNGTLNSAYSAAFQIIGGTPPYASVQILKPAASSNENLPDGLSADTTNLASGFFTIAGTPIENGNFNPNIVVTDGAEQTLAVSEFFNIFNSPGGITIFGSNFLSVPVGTPISQQLSACCVASYVWSVASGNIPTGLSLSPSGMVTGTFTTAGTYTFLLEAADAAAVAAPGFKQGTIVVTPITITTNSLPNGNVGTAYSQALAASGNTGTLTWSVAPGYYLPPGLTLQTNGTLNGTPTATGQYFFQVSVTDQNGSQAFNSYTINIFGKGQTSPLSVANGPNLGTWAPGTDWIGLGVNGGNGTYSYSLVSGKLPPGLFLSKQVPNFFAPNQQAGLIGVATTPGTYNFSLKITSGGQPYGGASITVPYQVTISSLNLQDATPQDGFVGVVYSYAFTPIQNAGPVTFTVNCSPTGCTPPPGLTLSSSGVLSGTPTTPGSYQIAMHLSDGVNIQNVQFNLTIYAVQITTPSLLPINGTQGDSYSATLTASGGSSTGYSFSIVAGGLPNGLSLASNGTISGTINSGPGLYGFGVQVKDSENNTGNLRMSLDVVGPGPGMQINTTWLNDPVLGDHYGAVVSLCCGGTAPFTWTASNLPPGLTFEPNTNSFTNYPSNPGGLQIYGIPEQTGTYDATFTVTDANLVSTSVIIPMHVSILDVAIGNTGNGYNLPNGTLDAAYSPTAFLVLGGTGTGYKVTQTPNGNFPDGLKLSGVTLSGTPLENGGFFEELGFADSAGNTLSRGEGIFINDVSGANIFLNGNGFFGYDLGSTLSGVAYSRQFFECCEAGTVFSVATGSKLPPGLTLSSTGLLSGTPTVKTGTTYSFLIRASRTSGSPFFGQKMFTLTITPITITTASLPSGTAGTAYSATLEATGGKGTLTWSQPFNQGSLLPPGLTLNANGTITGTPTTTPLASGSYFVIVQVTDSSKNTAIRGYGINIAP
jgi:hypothetical protein